MVTSLGKNNPYRKMGSGQERIGPGFFPNKKDNEPGENSAISDDATSNLRSAEDSAGGEAPKRTEDSLDGVRENEETAGGLYTGDGKGGSDGKSKGNGPRKRKWAIAMIFLFLVLGVGGTSFLGISSELVAWKENIYSMFGQNSAVISRRSNRIMQSFLRTNYDTTSFNGTKFKISSKLTKKLRANGIDYVEVEDADGARLRMLLYEDADGRYIPIVASDNDVQRVNALAGAEIDIDGVRVRLADSGMTLSEARRTNINDFDVNYDTATRTFTGKIAGWFDDVADSMYNRIVGRNARNQTHIDDPDEESVNKMLLGNVSEGVDDSDVIAFKEEESDNEEDSPTYRRADTSDEVDLGNGEKVTLGEIESESGKISTDTDVPDTEAVKASLGARAKKAAMMSSTVACGVLKGLGAISAAVGAVQTANVISYASKILEMADQVKNGDADETVHLAMNSLNKSTRIDLYDMNGEKVSVEGAVTEGAGWNAPFSSTNIVNEDDPSALVMNRELANKNALRNLGGDFFASIVGAVAGFGGGVAAFRACNAIQGLAGTVSFIADVASLFTYGISKVVKDTIKGAIEGSAIAGAMITISLIVEAITPTLAHWFVSQLGSIFLGKTGGFALLSGAQNIMNSNLQMSTGRYAGRENAIELFALTKDVEREWAAYERATKNPFDVTSKYTFLGSIYNAVLPIANMSGNTITSMVSSVASLTNDSVVALVSPSVSAASETNKFAASLSSEGNCGYLESVGVTGDFACNKYAGAYVEEIDTASPDDIYVNMQNYGSFDGEDSDGNPKINVNSDYAKYIVACVSSDTQPGTMNGAVQGFLTGIGKGIHDKSVVASGLVNFGRNFIPFEGALDAVEAGEEETNIMWNSGLACTGNTDDAAFNEKIKNFSMYNLDQRVLYNMGVIENNSTVAFLEDYYKENPLDYSFEGRIARISGMSKEEVEETLALIEYYNFVANYDSAARYAFGVPVVEEPHEVLFDNDNVVAENTYIILLNEISFADVRNRNFVV